MINWARLAVFDLETTGVDTETSRIVSACIAVLNGQGLITARWDWLADPGVEIPAGATAVHGISTDRARQYGRNSRTVVAEITQSLRVLFEVGVPVVIFNAPYDLTLLDRECRRHCLAPLQNPGPVIDPLVIDKALDRYRRGKRTLLATADLLGVPLDLAHDAGADAIAAGRVALAQASAFGRELDMTPDELHRRQAAWFSDQAARFTEYVRRTGSDGTFRAPTEWPVRPFPQQTMANAASMDGTLVEMSLVDISMPTGEASYLASFLAPNPA